MEEKEITQLASQIDRFDTKGNFKGIYFRYPKNIDKLKESLMNLGITDIIRARTTKATGTTLEEYMFEVNYQYSGQRKVIDDLERRCQRIKAWSLLRNLGGATMSTAEQDFFKRKDTEQAIINAKNNSFSK